MSQFVQVATTTADREEAVRLARSIVKARLAASAQIIGPVTSVFWHLGELGEGTEWQLYLKTTTDRYADLAAHLRQEHSWENPEITATELMLGSEDYFEWLTRTVESADDSG